MPYKIGALAAAGVRAIPLSKILARLFGQRRASAPDLRERARQLQTEIVAYDKDPTRLATCQHLQPIERAMRASGIPIRWRGIGYFEAQCCVDEAALTAHFAIELPLRYHTVPADRPLYEPPSVAINCKEHQISIFVIRPEDAKPDTPWFPAKA